MSGYRDRREALDPEEMQDTALRRNVFRAIAEDLTYDIRGKSVTDAPGEIARLMEKAFKAGMAARSLDSGMSTAEWTAHRRMTDRDLVPSALWAFEYMRIQGSNSQSFPHGLPPHAVLLMIRKLRRPFSDETKEDWYFATRHGDPYIFSTKAIGPLIKSGLIEAWETPNGTKLARFTEWGFELLVTGSTELAEHRREHRSSTVREWAAMLQGDYWHSAAVDMGLVKAEEPSPEENPDEAAQDDSQSFTP